MIHDLDILQAVQEQLRTKWPDCPIYLQEVKEGFQPPAFFLKSMTVATPLHDGMVYRDTDIYITYVPKKTIHTFVIFQTLADVLELFMDGLTVQDRHISFSTITEELLGEANDGGQITLSFSYYEAATKEETDELMLILHEKINGRE